MKEFLGMVEAGLRNLFKEKTDIVIFIGVIIIFILVLGFYLNAKLLIAVYFDLYNRTDYSYYKIATSMDVMYNTMEHTNNGTKPTNENLHIKRFDRYSGELQRVLTSDEEVTRKKNRTKKLKDAWFIPLLH